MLLFQHERDRRGSIRDQRWIDERPAAAERKERFGDFEIDLVNGARHRDNLFTAISAFMPYRDLLHAVTSDNGKEFADHARIADELEAGYYFAHPYHSWERGANENMNGLVRQCLPKGTSFENLIREEVKRIEWKLNNRPRKRLGFLTPLGYISRQVRKIYLTT